MKDRQIPLQTVTQNKIHNIKKLIALIGQMIIVNDEQTAQSVADHIKEKIDKIKVKVDLTTYSEINSDITAMSVLLLTDRLEGNAAISVPYIKVTYKNGEKRLLRSPNNIITSTLMGLLIALDYPMELCFFEVLSPLEQQPWQTRTVNEIYQPFIKEFYSAVHHEMGKYLLTSLDTTNLSDGYILLISIGCGDGADLKAIGASLSGVNSKICYAGIDINAENIKLAQNKLKNGYFFQGEVKDIAKHLITIKNFFRGQRQNTDPQKTVIIFSGLLQRHMLKGTVEATLYLQWACRFSNLVMISSIQHALTTRKTAKSIGYNVHTQNITYGEKSGRNETRVLYCLEKQSREQRVQYIIKKSDKRHTVTTSVTLDLSLSANPLGDLIMLIKEQSEYLKKVTLLDISWSNIADIELETLLKLMREKMPQLTRIIIANVEPWVNSLLQQKLPYIIYQRKDALNGEEVPEFSIPNAMFLRLFKSLPISMVRGNPAIGEQCDSPGEPGLAEKSFKYEFIDNRSLFKAVDINNNVITVYYKITGDEFLQMDKTQQELYRKVLGVDCHGNSYRFVHSQDKDHEKLHDNESERISFHHHYQHDHSITAKDILYLLQNIALHIFKIIDISAVINLSELSNLQRLFDKYHNDTALQTARSNLPISGNDKDTNQQDNIVYAAMRHYLLNPKERGRTVKFTKASEVTESLRSPQRNI